MLVLVVDVTSVAAVAVADGGVGVGVDTNMVVDEEECIAVGHDKTSSDNGQMYLWATGRTNQRRRSGVVVVVVVSQQCNQQDYCV